MSNARDDDERAIAVAESLSPQLVTAGGTVSALECVERARGHLYAFHQLMGRADRLLGESVAQLEAAGQAEFAGELAADIVGSDVLPERWTFQIVEEFDSGYWSSLRRFSERLTQQALGGQRHVAEAQMKRDGRTR